MIVAGFGFTSRFAVEKYKLYKSWEITLGKLLSDRFVIKASPKISTDLDNYIPFGSP